MITWTRELYNYRELLLAFSQKEIKIRYKQTVLGFLWAILQPAALTLIFTVVFGLFLKVNSNSAPYPVFAYSALLLWSFFTSAVSFGSLAVVNNASLVTKVYFPREIMPISAIIAALFDFGIASIIFILMLAFYGVSPSINLLYLLVIIPSFIILTSGIVFILTTINVLYRDVRFILPMVIQVLLYVTPVIYSLEQVPAKYRFFIVANPLSGLVEGFRQVTVFGKPPDLLALSYSSSVAILLFLIGFWFFKNKEKIFADVI